MSNTLIIRPRSGTFTKDFDIIGKMDPFVRITVGKEVLRTETAYGQSKNPVWKTHLSFKLTPQQIEQPNTVTILLETFDEDPGSNEFIGSANYKLSDVANRSSEAMTVPIFDKKNKSVGSLEVEFEVKLSSQMQEKTSPPRKTYKRAIGTVVVKPKGGRFDVGVTDKQEFYLVFIHGEAAYQTGSNDGPGRRPVFRDIISFPLYDGEDMIVRVFDNDAEKNEMVAEAYIQLPQLSRRGSVHNLTLPLIHNRLNVGEFDIEVEFFQDLFENPVKVYPVVSVRSGESISKKIQYTNPDRFKKNLTIRSEYNDLIYVKTEKLSILPNEYGEIRFKINGPPRGREEKCRIDIIVEDTNIIEESLLFKIKGV